MSVIRAFIAIDLPDDVRHRLAQVAYKLQQQLKPYPIRWVPAKNIHLTLKFLGDVSEHNLRMLTHLLAGEAETHRPFEFSVGTLGAFPDMRRPRVIWVGVEAPKELMALQRGIEQATAKLGYAAETRPFQPHLTLARVSRNANSTEIRSISRVLQQTTVGFLGSARVTEIHLYRSDLQPKGAIYTRLFTTSLNPDAPPAVA